MPPFFANTTYAEDLQHSHSILTTHVLHRGIQAGAFVGLTSLALRQVYSFSQSQKPLDSALVNANGALQTTTLNRALLVVGRGSVVGLGLISVALWGRMRGRDEVEWADRSWRLLQNAGQVEVDKFSYAGMLTGLLFTSAGVSRGVIATSALRLVGGMAIGNLAGVGGYIAWRYGVNKGRFEQT